jgi:hypothetical protein
VRISFDTLYNNYSSSEPSRANYVSQPDLFKEIGWDDFVGQPNYANTCAVRVSLALVKSGVSISPKSHNILKGDHVGKGVEVSMTRLANLLAGNRYLGAYESFTPTNAQTGVGSRKGVIAFHGIPGYSGGGPSDLVSGSSQVVQCASGCYFRSNSIWFWPLISSGTA